jgi:hypothetical protein
MKTQWDGLRVCEKDYDKRHPQDAVRETGSGCGTGPGGAGLDWNWGGGGYKPDLDPTTFIQEPNDEYFTNIPDGTFDQIVGNACQGYVNNPNALYFGLDRSASLNASEWQAVQNGTINALNTLKPYLKDDGSSEINILVLFFTNTHTYKQYDNATPSDIEELETWILGLNTALGTDFDDAVAEVDRFFGTENANANQKTFIFMTDGIPTPGSPEIAAAVLDQYPDIDRWCFNIGLADTTETAKLDNTPSDGVPVLASGDEDVIRDAMYTAFDFGQTCS